MTPLLELTPNRAMAALRRVQERIWQGRQSLPVEATRARATPAPFSAAKSLPRKPAAPGETWGRLYDQRWCRVEIPPAPKGSAQGGPRYLEWRDQGEATLYVDGVPHYGFDVAHRHVALPPAVREVWLECWCCQSAIWHPQATGLSPEGSVFSGAFLVSRDDAAWHAYHDLLCLTDLMIHLRAQQQPPVGRELVRIGPQPKVDRVTPAYRRLLRLLDDAVDALDTNGLAALQKKLDAAYRELKSSKSFVRAVLTGHAHIDLVWLWPERVGEAKAVHTFASVNRLLDLYPEMRFAYSQMASYRAVERLSPALYQAVAQRIRQKQWEPTGALYVESDTLLPCGEALARSFTLGQSKFEQLRGNRTRLCWLPDVFGYSACLPQLMQLAGVPWFFTTKLTWSAINRFPYSSFVWRGNDGSEVVAHLTQDVGYNNLVDLPRLHAAANAHAQSDVHPEFLHPTGYGDGGGGPTEEMCERARRMDRLVDTPEIVWGQPEDFFARLERRRADLPTYQGELYLEYHRGTYTTHGALKHSYRLLERALQTREAVAAALGQVPDLTATWRRLIFAQFHDYLPGSSVPEVYHEALPELQRLAEETVTAAQQTLSGRSSSRWHAFNPLPLPWRGFVVAPNGSREPIQVEIPPLSSATLNTVSPRAASASATNRLLQTDRLEAAFTSDGLLESLRIDGRALALDGAAAVPMLYPDHPAAFEAWDIDHHSLRLGHPAEAAAEIQVEKTASHEATLSVKRRIGEKSTLTLRFSAVLGEPVLRIDADVDWHEQQTLLKLHFPTRYRGSQARFGAPFGSVLRGQQPGPTITEAAWEVCGSRWAAVCNDGERDGLALITESKFGFGARSGNLSVSLLRGATVVGFDDHDKAAPRKLSRLESASPFTDQGSHHIRLALARHDLDAPRGEQAAALADTLFVQPLVYRGNPCSGGLLRIEGGDTLIPAWAQPLDHHSWLLRLHEVAGQSGTAALELAPGYRAERCGLEGQALKGAAQSAEIAFRPYEIVSVKISR